MSFGAFRGFHDRFTQGRVRVDVARNFGGGQLHALGQGQLGQQFGNIRTNHVRAQDFSILRLDDDFDKAGIISQTKGFAIGLEGEAAYLDLIALLAFASASVYPNEATCGCE